METAKKPRKRSVKLTTAALSVLNGRIQSQWQANGSGKLTREARAQLLDLSVPTADRVVSGKSVDRATLIQAYGKLGLKWNEADCDPDEGERAEPIPVGKASGVPFWLRYVGGIAGLLGLVLIITRSQGGTPQWVTEFTVGFDRGVALYHRAQYRESKSVLDQLVLLARANDSAGSLASALALSGELEAALGNLEQAQEHFLEAISLRRLLGHDLSQATLYLNLGVVECRLGDFAQADKHLQQARQLYAKYDDPFGVATAEIELGTLAYERDHLDLAEKFFVAAERRISGQGRRGPSGISVAAAP